MRGIRRKFEKECNSKMKIKRLQIKNWFSIEEYGLDPAKINIFKGPKGSGKSSIIEAIEKAFTNKNRRTEVIKHGKEEATLFIETDDGLQIERKIRSGKADYFKLRKGDEGVPSTEKFLKDFINGNIFRPIDWVNMDVKEQTKSILSMLQIDWNQEDIEKWFGEIPSNVDFNQHILMVLKAIEVKYYKDREEDNRQINELKSQVLVIKKDLPVDYDGEVWREKKVQDYYSKVSEAQKINNLIDTAKSLQENFENKIVAIKSNADSDKSRVQMKYKDQRQDIKDIIDLSKNKIEKANNALNEADTDLNVNLERSETKYKEDLAELEKEFEKRKHTLALEHQSRNEQLRTNLANSKEEQKDIIQLQENKITQKTEELNSLDALEKQELETIDFKLESEIKHEKLKVGEAAKYIENYTEVDIEPLQNEADEVAEMQSYLRQWDMMIDIRDNKLASKERDSAVLTERIAKARTMPSELLKTAHMPIDGISVDEKGLIRINNTLIDGLSDGEKLELAMKIAKAQAGELKVICLDKFESLNPAVQENLIKDILDDEFQYFITSTMSDEFEIEKLGDND